MASKQIRISITSALNAAGIEATKEQVNKMARSVEQSMRAASKSTRIHWADIKAAWDMGTAAIRRAWGAIHAALSSAFRFETQTTQFKTLIGNIDEARAHMADLKELGDTPPFSLDEFAKASRSLMVMTDGVLGYKKSLELIGDAAAATGHPIEEMGQAVGRLYAFIRDGEPLSRAVMQLRNMGVITPEVARHLQDLQEEGRSNAEIWEEVENALGRYKGAMADTEKTGEGLMGAIKSRWDSIVRAFGHAFEDSAKDGMGEVLDTMKELEESGAIERWADAAFSALAKVVEGAKVVAGWIGKIVDHLKAGRDALIETRQESESSGEEESFEFVREEQVNPYTKKKYYKGSNGSEQVEVIEDQAEKKRYEKRQREEERLAREAKRRAEEQARIKADLEDAQRRKEERDAKEAAEKKAKEEEKAAEKRIKEEERVAKEHARMWEKEEARREREERAEAARRERERQKEVRDKIKDQSRILSEAQKAESDAQSKVAAAESKVQQAWGWYRDRRAMAAQIREERANAKAEQQFEKDFARLSRRRDWRTAGGLSVADEAVRRVALAREEEAAARKLAAETAENTRRAAELLEKMNGNLEKSLEVS